MITFQNIEKQFGSKVLYNRISFSINPDHRVGLIGPNGTGKTVLLRIIAGKEGVDSGQVTIPSNLKIGYLPQEMNINASASPIEYMLEPFKHLLEIESHLEQLASYDNTNSLDFKKAIEEYDTLQKEHSLHNIYSLNARAKTILAGLGVPESSWDNTITALSGGFQMRVVLARLLLLAPDFLLLDEPTNHLDMETLIWLEKFLQKNRGGMLVVSHDRDFISRITTSTLEICNGEITFYNGNIDSYFAWKEENRNTELRRLKNLQNKIEKAEQFITRFKAKNTKASQARSKMKQLEKFKDELPDGRPVTQTIHFQFPKPMRSGTVPLKLENVSVSYGTLKVLDELSLTLTRGDKIAVLGPNGAGKSTLLKTCSGIIQPDSGVVTPGHNTTIRYYSQHRLDQLDPKKTLYETVSEVTTKYEKTFIQSVLGAFLFTDDEVFKNVSVLSGGEKSRLSLATLLADPGNLLILDEPTNHLDIESVERLTQALESFEGTLLIVSHDEYFTSRIANRIVELRPGKFRDFPGNLSDYRSYIEEGFIDSFTPDNKVVEKKGKTIQKSKEERIQKRQETKRIERKIERAERAIEALEKKMTLSRSELSSPEFASNSEKLAEIHNKIESLQTDYDNLLQDWERLHLELEKHNS